MGNMRMALLKDILNLPLKLSVILGTILVVWTIEWIYILGKIIFLAVKCKRCVQRKNCEFSIFSEHCLKRYCMNENERKKIQELIEDLE